MEIAVEMLQQRLNKLDLIQKELEVEPELQSTIRVRVKRAPLEHEREKCYDDLDHVIAPLQVKAYYKKHSKESIGSITGNSPTRSNTSFSNIPDAQTPPQIQPYLQKTDSRDKERSATSVIHVPNENEKDQLENLE